MIRAVCPASCGELIQGYILGGEKLISYAVDMYSSVSLYEGKRPDNIPASMKKAYMAVDETFRLLGYSSEYSRDIVIEIDSQISAGKGMASSTADMCAAIACASRYIGKRLSKEELARICTGIEPTDSTIFNTLTLFDHVGGNICRDYGKNIESNVILIEGIETIDTVSFHKKGLEGLIKSGEREMKRAIQLFEEGIFEDDMEKIGKAATISSIERQNVLKKHGLEELIEKSMALGAYGINVAHSGSTVGILYPQSDVDMGKLIYEIGKLEIVKAAKRVESCKIVSGGARLQDM